MTAEIVQIEDERARFERDRKIFRLKLTGFPYWQIAKELNCSTDEVKEALTRMCGGVTAELKARTVEYNLERIDDLMQIYYIKARAGDKDATVLCMRLMDRQAKYLGLDVMPRSDAPQHDKREPTRHEKIRAAIYRMARGPVIEGEAVEVPQDERPIPQ